MASWSVDLASGPDMEHHGRGSEENVKRKLFLLKAFLRKWRLFQLIKDWSLAFG